MTQRYSKVLLTVLPVLSFWYIALFLTIFIWYPEGLDVVIWYQHVVIFSGVFFIWLMTFFAYSLFDLDTIHSLKNLLKRLFGATVVCFVLAVMYFYLQPALLLTPRRFLLVQIFMSSVMVFFWYWVLLKLSYKLWQIFVFAHTTLPLNLSMQSLIADHATSGLVYKGVFDLNSYNVRLNTKAIIVLPPSHLIKDGSEQELFELRKLHIRFIEYNDLYENLTRTVHLSTLTDLWFLNSIDYSTHALFDFAKRALDILTSLMAGIIFIVTSPILALLVKITSKGPIFFRQSRVGQYGKPFTLYKYRTMTVDSSSDTWAHSGQKITWIGRLLRATRLDELPQAINILKGEMSVVGPRPEQVQIVEQMRQQIPYYDERHIVKPGLTGWAQLHVYASSVEETKRKLQYDLYYIKHRSLLFDAEIILKTVYNIITLSGR